MTRRSLITVLLLLAPRAAFACPVCFGENDSPLALAMNSGILFMLGIVGIMLAAFASFFVYLMRRAKLADLPGPADSAAGAGHHISGRDPQEGTASC